MITLKRQKLDWPNIGNLEEARTKRSVALFALFIFFAINLLTEPFCLREKAGLNKSAIFSSKYELIQKGPWSWWLARAFFLAQPAEIVLMGDSQMNAAVFQADAFTSNRNFDCVVDREAFTLEQLLAKTTPLTPKIINLATAGAMVSDQYLIAKALFPKAPPKIVIIGISPRCFLDNTLLSASTTETFQFFMHYVSIGSLVHLAFPDALQEVDWYLKQYLPLLRIREQDFAFLQTGYSAPQAGSASTTHLPKALTILHTIYGATGDVSPGTMIMTPAIIPGFFDNSKEYRQRYKHCPNSMYKAQQKFFPALLEQLRQINSKVIIVAMPCTPILRSLLPDWFWSDYQCWIAQQCARYGAIWIDLSKDKAFTKSCFLDNVHLNTSGAELLMHRLCSIIESGPDLTQVLNYDRPAVQK